MDETQIREVLGVKNADPVTGITAQEKETRVRIVATHQDNDLTPAAARRFASQLYRLARRVENRQAVKS